MAVKLIMTWNIVRDRQQQYFEFVVREFIPGMQRLGFTLSDAWATAYGSRPQILVGAVLPSMAHAQRLLHSEEWHRLKTQLHDYIDDYSQKIVEARNGFQF